VKDAAIAVAALASPIVWFVSEWAGFAFAPLACSARSNAALWIVAVVALLLVCGSGFVAWTQWNAWRPEGDQPPGAVMPRWLAISAVVLSGSFIIVIVAQTIPSLILGGCE
jgi:hypothetical protein